MNTENKTITIKKKNHYPHSDKGKYTSILITLYWDLQQLALTIFHLFCQICSPLYGPSLLKSDLLSWSLMSKAPLFSLELIWIYDPVSEK